IAFKGSQLAGELIGNRRSTKVEAFQHQWHDVALVLQRSLNLAPQPVFWLITTLQRGRGEQHNKVRPCLDVSQDDAIEIAAGEPIKIEEHVIPVVVQVLVDRQRSEEHTSELQSPY